MLCIDEIHSPLSGVANSSILGRTCGPVWVVFSQGQGVCMCVEVYYTWRDWLHSRAQSCQTDNTCIVTTDTVPAIAT